jgi:hypothetical protein
MIKIVSVLMDFSLLSYVEGLSLQSIFPATGLPSDFDLIYYLLYVGNSGSEFLCVLPFIVVANAASESQYPVFCLKTNVLLVQAT